MEDAIRKIEARRRGHNEYRPHSSPGDLTPAQFIEQYRNQGDQSECLPAAHLMIHQPSGGVQGVSADI